MLVYTPPAGEYGSLIELRREAEAIINMLDQPKTLAKLVTLSPKVIGGIGSAVPTNGVSVHIGQLDGRLFVQAVRDWAEP